MSLLDKQIRNKVCTISVIMGIVLIQKINYNNFCKLNVAIEMQKNGAQIRIKLTKIQNNSE